MKKMGLVLILLFWIIPCSGWAKQHVFWFVIPACRPAGEPDAHCQTNPDDIQCHWCDQYLTLQRFGSGDNPDLVQGELTFTLRFRDPQPPYRALSESYTYQQTEALRVYDLKELLPLLDRYASHETLEVTTTSKDKTVWASISIKSIDGTIDLILHSIQKR